MNARGAPYDMYWAFTTMTTVGYGDISATTIAERVFAILGMIAGGFVFSLLIGSMAGVMASAKKREVALQTKLQHVTSFLRDNNIPHSLSSKVYQFARVSGVNHLESERVIRALPYGLRRDIMKLLYDDLLKKVPLFLKSDEAFCIECCSRMTMMFWPKNEIVYRRGEISHDIYFISKGQVNILKGTYNPSSEEITNDQVEAVFLPGSYFGEGAVLGFKRRNQTATTRTMCQFSAVSKEDLIDLVELYPAVYKELSMGYLKRMATQNMVRATAATATYAGLHGVHRATHTLCISPPNPLTFPFLFFFFVCRFRLLWVELLVINL